VVSSPLVKITSSTTPACCFGICSGAIDLTVTNGHSPYTYLWSTASTTQDHSDLCPGIYTVTVTDAFGCTQTATTTVTQPSAVTLSTVVTPINSSGGPGGVDLTATGGTPPYTYAWGNGNTSQDLTVLQPGSYCVTVSDSKGCTATTCPVILMVSDPNTSIVINAVVQNACGTQCNGSITPTVSGATGSYTYTWYGPGGFTSNQNKLVNLCSGTYTLIVTDTSGKTNSATFTIHPSGSSDPLTILSSNPAFCNATAGSGSKCEQLCPNARVTYYVNPPQSSCAAGGGNPPAVNFVWTVNGAESWSLSPDTKQVNVVWGKTGSGDISVMQEGGSQCIISGVHCVNILENPKARFSTSPALAAPADTLLQVCKGQVVFFKNESLAADLYEWTFSDDASVVTEQSPKHEYNQPGLFSVRFIARTNCLCADTTWLRVRVLDAETPLLNCVNTLCPGEVITYSTPSNCASYEWSVSPNGLIIGGGSATDDSVTVRWLSGPDGTLSLRALGCGSNVCPSTAVVQVPILSDQAEIRGPELVCPDAEEVYQITAFDGALYKWTLAAADGVILEGQGTNRVTVKWGKSAFTKRPLVVEYYNCYLGCQGADTILVKVSPQFGIVGPVEACDNTARTFSAKTFDSQSIMCEWTFYAPDGSVAHQMTSGTQNYAASFGFGPGTYRLVARPVPADREKTCSPEAEWKVLVQANPQKPFSISGQTLYCPTQPLTFKAEGVSPANDVRWQVMLANNIATDGGTGNPKNFAFNGAGNHWVAAYQVTTDALACKSDTVRLLVKELGIVNVEGPNGVCLNEVATYTAPLYQGFDYQWKILPADAGVIIKGGKTNTLEVQWVKAGLGTAELTVCGKKATKNTAIFTLPEPDVTHPDGLCPAQKAAVATLDAYTAYSWQTASGAALSTTANPSLGPGAYLLVVTDANGCKGSTDFQIDAFPVPNLTITTSDPTGFCNNERYVNIKALTTQDGDYQYEWFRDGTPLNHDFNTLVTNQYGNYTCRATNQYGCSATDGTINVFEFCGGVCHNPTHKPRCEVGDVSYQILPTARCDSFQFKVIGGPLYPPGTATWHFGESGSTYLGNAQGDEARFKFSNAGQYIIVLYATLTNGAECTVLDSLNVDAVARFSATPACIGDSTRFKDVSTFLPHRAIASWAWELGNIATPGPDLSLQREPAHAYALPGTSTVTLTVTTTSGCTSSFSKNINIPFLPNDAFATVPTVCAGNATPFAWDEPVASLTWDFGEAASGAKNSSTGSPTYHTYAAAGAYTVTAVPRNAWGCTASYSRPATITANTLAGNITPPTPAQICEGKTLALNAPPVAGATYLWSNGLLSPSITVSETGIYSVTITSVDGCRLVPPARSLNVNPAPDGTIKALEINFLGQVTGVSFPTLTVCHGTDVNLKAEANSTYNFSWSGGGGTDDELLFIKTRNNLLPVGTHTYSVTVTNPATGCTAVTAPFTVTVNPTPSGFGATANSFCAGTPSEVKYTGPAPQPSWSLLWNNGEVGPAFTTTDAGKYFVRVINEFGCAANSAPVVIRPGPNVAALPGGCHSRCKPDTLCLPALPGIASWQWYHNGSPIPGATSGQFVAQQSGTYWAVLTDNTGCKAQSKDLYLDLYDGFGTVAGRVWSDVNGNGVIDAADTLLAAIPLIVNQNGSPYATAQSAPNGHFSFPNVLSTQYTVLVDAAKLSPQWEIVIGQRDFTLSGCGAYLSGDLLLHKRACLPAQQELQFTVCAGGSAFYNGTAVAAGSSESFTFQTLLGCDSIVTVNVAALPVLRSELNVEVCPGTPYTYAGAQIPANSSRDFMLKTAFGCDSIVTVNVSALPLLTSVLNAKTCPGTTYAYGSANLVIGSTTEFTLKTASGCDSVVTVNVAALPTSASVLNVKACPGGSYDYNGTAVPTGTSQVFALKNWLGCDSLVTLTVAPLPISILNLAVKTCPGTTYTYAGTDLAIGTSQSFIFKNHLGCDSIVTVTVSALPLLTSVLNAKTCPGTTYTYGSANLVIGSTTEFMLKTASGCDSMVTVNVTALPTSASVLNVKACPGGSYDYNGTQVPTGTSQVFALKNWLGCDSLVTLTVAPLPISVLNLAVKTCPGTTYTYAGTDLAIGTSQSFTLKNHLGCDSVVTVTVAALPTSASTLNVKTCPGTTYAYGSSNLVIGSTTEFTLKTASGCDSVVTVNVSALPTSAAVLNVKACPGGSYDYNGTQVPTGTSQVFALKNWLGCDSLVTLTVAPLPISVLNLAVKTCPGTTYNYAGTHLAIGTSQGFTFKNHLGCDSVVTVTVGALPTSASALTLRTCPGTTVAYGGANLAVGASQSFTLKNWLGCDSVVAVTVAALPVSSSVVTLTACPGTTVAYGGANLAVGASQSFTLKNWLGCDSVVAVTVAALPVSSSILNVKVCPGMTYTYAGVSLAAGETRDFHFINWADCDSVVTVSVSAWPDLSFDVASLKSCATVPNGGLQVLNLLGGSPPLAYSLDGAAYQPSPDFAPLSPGDYMLRVRDDKGCIFEKTANIEEYGALDVSLPDAVLACDQASVRLEAQVSGDLTALGFLWSNGATGPVLEASEGGKVWVEVSNVCQKIRREAAVRWGELGGETSLVYMSNVFKPVGALVENSVFRPHFAANVTVLSYSLDVFDRWGNLVFRSEDTGSGWDGVFRTRLSDGDVYPWLLRARVLYCGREVEIFERGDVTVVR